MSLHSSPYLSETCLLCCSSLRGCHIHLLSLARLNCQNYLSELFILVSNQPSMAAGGPSNSTQAPFPRRLSDSPSAGPREVSCGMSLPVRTGQGLELGSSPVMVLLAHRHASLQHDCWLLMEDGALVLGLRHLAECF